MISVSENFFHAIKDLSEKYSIFRSACESKAEIVVKTPEPMSEIAVLCAQSFEKDILACSLKGQARPVGDRGEFIVQMYVGGEKYLGFYPFEKKLDTYYLDTITRLYHLQRREDFRLKIPASFSAHAEVKSAAGQVMRARWSVIDFSGGGCGLEVKPSGALKINDVVEMDLHLEARAPLMIKGTVKHLTAHPDKSGTDWAGLQFIELSDRTRNKIIAIKLDIYRELFSALK